jgi:hypothetical protein
MTRASALLVLASLLACKSEHSPSSAGREDKPAATFEGEIDLKQSSPPTEWRFSVAGGRARFVEANFPGVQPTQWTLIDAEREMLYDVSESSRTYSERPMFPRPGYRGPQLAPAVPKLTKTGRAERIADEPSEEWVVVWGSTPYTSSYRIFASQRPALAAAGDLVWRGLGGNTGWTAGVALAGMLPLRAINLGPDGGDRVQIEVTRIERKHIAEDKLILPTNFRKTTR